LTDVPAALSTMARGPTLKAQVNYLEKGIEDSVWYAADSWRSHMPLDTQTVVIEDVRGLRDEFTLDHQGLQLIEAPSAVTDFLDREAAALIYLPELERAVRAATGASRVVIGNHWVHRHSDRSVRFGEEGTTYPGRYAHIDYSDLSGPQTARLMLWDDPDAERLLKGRYTVINLWRAISEPPQDCPLCVADATTVQAEDLVVSHVMLGLPGQEMRLQTNMVTFNPAHRWVYFSDMRRDELLMFRGYDTDPARFRRVPHTAFDDPAAVDAPPRESIDIRCVAFFD
jgi:hypothetical protein